MLKALNWQLCPETVISWLKLYAQVDSLKEGPSFLVPQFSQETYIQITQVCTECMPFLYALITYVFSELVIHAILFTVAGPLYTGH